MEKLIYLIIILTLFISCKEEKYFEEVVSEKEVTISLAEFPKSDEDLVINIPLEFNLYLNNYPDIYHVMFNLYKDGSLINIVDDYLMKDRQTDKIIFGFNKYKYPNFPKKVCFITRKIKISTKEAKEIVNRYNLKFNIKNSKDTIKVISYKKFRDDHPEFINGLRKNPDYLELALDERNEETIFIKEKINW